MLVPSQVMWCSTKREKEEVKNVINVTHGQGYKRSIWGGDEGKYICLPVRLVPAGVLKSKYVGFMDVQTHATPHRLCQ